MSAVSVKQSNQSIRFWLQWFSQASNPEIDLRGLCSQIIDHITNLDQLYISDRVGGIIWVKESQRCLDKNSDSLEEIENQLEAIEKICRTFSRERLIFLGHDPKGYPSKGIECTSSGYILSKEMFAKTLSKKAEENFQEAFEKISNFSSYPYVGFISNDLLSSLDSTPRGDIKPIHTSMSFSQGLSSKMKSYSLFLDLGQSGSLSGVFNGNGLSGDIIAKKAKDISLQIFSEVLEQAENHGYLALNLLIYRIRHAIADLNLEMEGSSTAMLSFVHPSGEVWTATLGPDVAYLYKLVDDKWECLPLSDHIKGIEVTGFSSELMDGSDPIITKHCVGKNDVLLLASRGIFGLSDSNRIKNILRQEEVNPAELITERGKKFIISVAHDNALGEHLDDRESAETFLSRVEGEKGIRVSGETFEEKLEQCRLRVRQRLPEYPLETATNVSIVFTQF